MTELISLLAQIPLFIGIGLVAAFHVGAIVELWRDGHSRLLKVVWSLIVMFLPFVGAALYYIFVSKTWRKLLFRE